MAELVRADALYQQLAKAIRSGIEEGEYPPGSLLPSEAALGDRYGVSRPTVRLALAALRTEGLIAARMGKGSYVRPAASDPTVIVERAAGTAEPSGQGEPEHYRIGADPRIAQLLKVETGHPMFVQNTTGTQPGTGRPVLIRRLLPFTTADGTALESQPFPDRPELIAILTAAHGQLSATEYVRARMPTAEESAALQLGEVNPIVETTRVTGTTDQPLFAETERTSADGIDLAYPLH